MKESQKDSIICSYIKHDSRYFGYMVSELTELCNIKLAIGRLTNTERHSCNIVAHIITLILKSRYLKSSTSGITVIHFDGCTMNLYMD